MFDPIYNMIWLMVTSPEVSSDPHYNDLEGHLIANEWSLCHQGGAGTHAGSARSVMPFWLVPPSKFHFVQWKL